MLGIALILVENFGNWEAFEWVVVRAVAILSIRSETVVQWFLIALRCVPMAHGQKTFAIVVKRN